MPVFSLWESHFPPAAAGEGRAITEAIWRDMRRFEGYLAHELIEDLDDPGHLFVVSRWTTRRRADEALHEYADHPDRATRERARLAPADAVPRPRRLGAGVTPETLLSLANLTVPRKPGRGATIHPDPLASPATAAQALSLPRLDSAALAALRELHETIVQLVDGLLSGRGVVRPAARLTELAQPSIATVRLDVDGDRTVRPRLESSEPTPAAALARRVALELAEIDLARLKRCERPACDLVFYDTTRSGTRRWHADSPCGNRERQRRHRVASRRE